MFITYCRSRAFMIPFAAKNTEDRRENRRVIYRSRAGGPCRPQVRPVPLLSDRGSRDLGVRDRRKPGQKHAVSGQGNGYRESRSRKTSGCRGHRPHREKVDGGPEGCGNPHPSGSLRQRPGRSADVPGGGPDGNLTVSPPLAVRTSVPCRETRPGGPLRRTGRRPLSWPCSGRRTFSRTWA